MTRTNPAKKIPRTRSPARLPPGSHFLLTAVLAPVWLLGALGGLYAAGVVVLKSRFPLDPGLPLEALLTFSVGMMLSVRISKAYDRWWEARTQWGKLVNVSRKLAIKVRAYTTPDESERLELHRLIQGFARALKNHLRGGAALQTVRGFEDESDEPIHVPGYLSRRIYDFIERLSADGRLTDTERLMIDGEARELLEVSGACERIKGTLMPPSLRAFIRFSILVLLVSLPWDLAQTIGWLAVPALVLATFFACGGESMAHHLERPFGVYFDDLDLESYSNGIDRVTAELLDVPTRADA